MKILIKNFKNNNNNNASSDQKKLKIKEEGLKEIKIQAVLVVSEKTSLLKTEIVSHIRAILGVTRVDILKSYVRPHFYISKLNLKIDTEPFGLSSVQNILVFIKHEIIKIPGVKRLTFISKPELSQT